MPCTHLHWSLGSILQRILMLPRVYTLVPVRRTVTGGAFLDPWAIDSRLNWHRWFAFSRVWDYNSDLSFYNAGALDVSATHTQTD